MNWKEFVDIGTTLLLASVPLTLLLISYFYAYIPPEYIALVTIVLAILSQYTSNQRVKDSVETVKKWIRWDYITTILLVVWPIIASIQPQLLVNVPPALLGLVTALFAITSQWVADKREENSEIEET
jgi:membrane glycosyltransferase